MRLRLRRSKPDPRGMDLSAPARRGYDLSRLDAGTAAAAAHHMQPESYYERLNAEWEADKAIAKTATWTRFTRGDDTAAHEHARQVAGKLYGWPQCYGTWSDEEWIAALQAATTHRAPDWPAPDVLRMTMMEAHKRGLVLDVAEYLAHDDAWGDAGRYMHAPKPGIDLGWSPY